MRRGGLTTSPLPDLARDATKPLLIRLSADFFNGAEASRAIPPPFRRRGFAWAPHGFAGVVAGRATFRIGDEQVEAGPGQVVSAPDPAAVRSYGALEPGTRIVCIGGAGGDEGYGTWIADAADG